MNASNDCLSVAIPFAKINRSKGLLHVKSDIHSDKFLRKWCQVKFEYNGRCKETEGIVLIRYIPIYTLTYIYIVRDSPPLRE